MRYRYWHKNTGPVSATLKKYLSFVKSIGQIGHTELSHGPGSSFFIVWDDIKENVKKTTTTRYVNSGISFGENGKKIKKQNLVQEKNTTLIKTSPDSLSDIWAKTEVAADAR